MLLPELIYGLLIHALLPPKWTKDAFLWSGVVFWAGLATTLEELYCTGA